MDAARQPLRRRSISRAPRVAGCAVVALVLIGTVASCGTDGDGGGPTPGAATPSSTPGPTASTTLAPLPPFAVPTDLAPLEPAVERSDGLSIQDEAQRRGVTVEEMAELSTGLVASIRARDYDLQVEWRAISHDHTPWPSWAAEVVVAVRGGTVVAGSVVSTEGDVPALDLRTLSFEGMVDHWHGGDNGFGYPYLVGFCAPDDHGLVRWCGTWPNQGALPSYTVTVQGYAER